MADAELERFFSAGGESIEPDVAAELQSMMRLHGLSAEDLFYKWESYCIRLDLDAGEALTLTNVRRLKQSIQDALEKSAAAASSSSLLLAKTKAKAERKVGGGGGGGGGVGAPSYGGAANNDMYGMLNGLMPSTPTSGARLNRNGGAASGGGVGGSALRNRMRAAKISSSPAGTGTGLGEQLSALQGLPPQSSFSDRPNPGQVIEVLNSQLEAAETTTPPLPQAPYAEPRIKLTAASDQKKMAYKPLAMKLSEASEILDDRIDDMATLVQQHHNLDDDAFGNAASRGTAEIVAVGRIASDSTEGRLNAASLVLETSRRTGMGFRVPLKLDSLLLSSSSSAASTLSFFPGQIVALRGTNATGNEFVVREMLEIPLLPGAASTGAALEAHVKKMRSTPRDPEAMVEDDGGEGEGEGESEKKKTAATPPPPPPPLNIIFAAGPYTADDNLDFEPLQVLCSQAADTYADAVVLMGPFLDADHPLVATGDFELAAESLAAVGVDGDSATMATVFRCLVAPALNRLAARNPHVVVIMVPSVRDVLAKHVSWPQEAMARRELGLPRAVRVVANPMTLSVNEAVVALSSQDVLWELRAEELALQGRMAGGGGGGAGESGSGGDLMARLCRHLVEQRHFFPVFPPTERARLPRTGTTEGVSTGAVLDLSYLKLGEMVNVRPDVMLTPSALPAFAKVVESVVVINPGYLSKRRGAGTFARMTLYAPQIQGDGLQSHGVFERARVEIVRI